MAAILQVKDLRVGFFRDNKGVEAVRGVSLVLQKGEVVGIAGESGSGKTLTGLAIMRLIPPPGMITNGTVSYDGCNLLDLSSREMEKIRGKEIFMIFQSPAACLNPSRKVGAQIAEVWHRDRRLTRWDKRRKVAALLEQVGIEPAKADSYPFQLSGGMRQRVLIAMALALQPKVLIADEPTTGLDPVREVEILRLLSRLRSRCGVSVLLISHDCRALAHVADRIIIMRQGAVIEEGKLPAFFQEAKHPYSCELISSARLLTLAPPLCHNLPGPPLLTVSRLSYKFAPAADYRAPKALDDISFEVSKGEVLGIVGVSGAGKTTLARCLMGLEKPTAGLILFQGRDITYVRGQERQAIWEKMQIIWQDPYSYLNPYRRVKEIIRAPLANYRRGDRKAQESRVQELMALVRLDLALGDRYPHELSGGQCQKVALALALALTPALLICDEPFAGLDTSTQKELLKLLMELHQDYGLTCILISHDLYLVRQFCSRIIVIQEGRIVEAGKTAEIFGAPQNPHTQRLLSCLLTLPGPETTPDFPGLRSLTKISH